MMPPASDLVTVSVTVSTDPATAFAIFTKETDLLGVSAYRIIRCALSSTGLHQYTGQICLTQRARARDKESSRFGRYICVYPVQSVQASLSEEVNAARASRLPGYARYSYDHPGRQPNDVDRTSRE